MCGIAGIVRREDPRAPLMAPLQRMQAALRHRGPDDAGLYQSAVSLDGWQCGLAHTRLAILDLSAAGHQPMASPDGRFHISFNGEIYNFRELRAQLIAAGESFHTETDTELLLRLYLLRGPDCLRDLAGMFAFAVWDAQEQSLFLARDPLGVKPLYFCVVGSTLAFASELRSLLAADLLPRRLSARALSGFLLYGSVQESPTLIAGASLLPAGCWLQWRGGRIREQRYYDVQFQLPASTPDRDAVAATRAALVDSVRRHFVSDVPVGIFLSGGVDSTVLVALARHVGISKIRTFSLAFANPALDEGDLAASTALHFGTEHHVWRLEEAEAKSLLARYWESVDQPSVDGFNTFCVSKWAHDHGAKVVLSGLGGDEFFGGYGTFQRVPRLHRWARNPLLSTVFRRWVGQGLHALALSSRQRRLASFLGGPGDMDAAYWTVRGIFSRSEVHHLAAHYLPAAAPVNLDEVVHLTKPVQPTLEDSVSYFETSRYMRNQLLRDSDAMSMAWGLELRVPFVDSRLLDTLVTIPASVRLRAGKQLLLEAVPELPAWVTAERKRGFSFPFEQWMRSTWRETFAPLETRSPVALETWYRRWALLALEKFIAQNRVVDCQSVLHS